MVKPQRDSENFSRGPVGKTGSGGGRAWRTLCKVAPRFILLIRPVQCSNGAQLWQDPQCPAVTKLPTPYSPLMPSEDLFCTAPWNVCPSQSVPPLRRPPAGPQPARPQPGEDSHSCTSQISESSGGSFLSCRRSANTCSEWTLLSVRRLTSFISIRGNISGSWGWWMET